MSNSSNLRHVARIDHVQIMVDEGNWVVGAAAINAVLTLPQIPGFPDYRWHSSNGRVFSTQNQCRIKSLTLENTNQFSSEQAYKLWVDGECAYLTQKMIDRIVDRGGRTKHEFKPRKDLGILVLRDGKLFGSFANRNIADTSISRPGTYQFFELTDEYDVNLTVRKNLANPIEHTRFYGIDEQ